MIRKKNLMPLLAAVVLGLWGVSSTAAAKGPIRFGVRGGVQTQSIRASKDEMLGLFGADKDFGYQLGFMARFDLPIMFIQPELMYSSHRFTMDLEDGVSGKVSLKNVELPVMVGAKVAFLRVMAGPGFNLMNDTKNKMGRTSMAVNSDITRSLLAYQLGVGVELGKIIFDVRYGGQFKKAEQTVIVGESQARTYKLGMNQWQFNLGYFF